MSVLMSINIVRIVPTVSNMGDLNLSYDIDMSTLPGMYIYHKAPYLRISFSSCWSPLYV